MIGRSKLARVAAAGTVRAAARAGVAVHSQRQLAPVQDRGTFVRRPHQEGSDAPGADKVAGLSGPPLGCPRATLAHLRFPDAVQREAVRR